MAADGSGNLGGMAGGKDEGADARMGMIQVNDLVYKLETDLSVAINRTHKTQFFQNQTYQDTQTMIAILNGGADYMDPRRTFLSFDMLIPTTDLGVHINDPFYKDAFVSCYFGKNGSVLNLFDSVVVSTRSGDELSRVNDYGQMMNMLLPEAYGPDWRDTIGQGMGFGSFVGGRNNTALIEGGKQSEQRRVRFTVPLYCVSPFFNYGRLQPSMLTSGLRIEIKFKRLEVATQQFWEGFPAEYPSEDLNAQDPAVQDIDETEYKVFLGPSTGTLGSGLTYLSADFPPNAVTYQYTAPAVAHGAGLLTIGGTNNGAGWFSEYEGRPGVKMFNIGDTIAFTSDNIWTPFPYDNANPPNPNPNYGRNIERFRLINFSSNTVAGVIPEYDTASFAAHIPQGTAEVNTAPGPGVALIGAWRLSQRGPLPYQRDFNAPAFHGKFLTPNTPLTRYTISNPQIAMCAIQLTDAIQRTLNEFSTVNGLEIVYADYDRTSTPLKGGAQMVYTEVRKSASRALSVMARVVRNTPDTHRYDSFASCFASYWKHYQWQLGSLYFPQQRVDDGNSTAELMFDNVLSMMYSYTQDAFDRYHPKAAPTMATMRGVGIDFNKLNLHPTEVHAEHGPSTYLAPYSAFGKWGSFVNGGTTVATTLERSTLFDLSGIPINNSRVLALRGEVQFAETDPAFQATLFVFLKYVRLARVFLVNCEVEQ